MKKSIIFNCNFLALSVLMLASCNSNPDISGVWVGTPMHLDNIGAADQASATMTFIFANDSVAGHECGTVKISALINAEQAVSAQNSTVDAPYEVSVAATAAIDGRWSYEEKDDDDIILAFDPQSLQVRVDPDGVAFSENLLTGSQQPVTDSLTTATAQAWTKSVSTAMSDTFHSISKISDIKIKNGILSCEINDRDYCFRRVDE